MPSTSTLVDSIYTRRVSAGECYPPDLVKSQEEIRKTICCRRSNGQEFEANMEFGSSEIDGEQCVRVIIRHQGADSMQARIRELKNQPPPHRPAEPAHLYAPPGSTAGSGTEPAGCIAHDALYRQFHADQ